VDTILRSPDTLMNKTKTVKELKKKNSYFAPKKGKFENKSENI
jgi:hypothetical protein